MNIVFMGTPDFAVPSLEKIASSGHTIQLVVTQPDRPKGRGRKLLPPPVKSVALSMGFEVAQPEKMRESGFIEKVRSLAPDVIAVVAFGQFLPTELIEISRIGTVNVHPSLLPRYRGAAPLQRAVMAGDIQTGVVTMYISDRMDAGDLLLRKEIVIGKEENTGHIHDKLKVVGADLLVETITNLKNGTATPEVQDESQVVLAPKITKEECQIDWNKTSEEVHNHIRGLYPVPGSYTFLAGRRIIVTSAEVSNAYKGNSGEISNVSPKGIEVATGMNGSILIKRLRPEGKREMAASEFLAGHKIKRGITFD